MDLAEREAFFAQGRGGGGVAPGPSVGGGRPPVYPQPGGPVTPSDASDWGPSPESQHESRERLARERQLEYNEYLAAQQEREAHAHALGAGPNNDPHAHGRPGPVTEDTTSPGLVFDEEQRPRPKGGLRDIHNSDQKRRNREHERKRQYAAELQQQMAEQARRKQLERQKSRARDLQAVGMGNVIQDMHDGRLDGVDENGVPLGYDYARVHHTDQDAFDVAEKTPAPRFSAGAQNAAARENRERGRGPPGAMRGARGSDGSEDQDRAAAAASRRRKAEYQRELEAQMADNAARKARARREEEERDARDDRAAAKYDPWGKAGGGAPARDASGNVQTDLREMRNDFNDRLDDPAAAAAYRRGQQQRQQHAAYGHTPDARLGGPDDEPGYHPGRRDGRSNPTQGARGNFRQREDAHPREIEAKNRARDELQRALAQQIEEKRRRKEEEKRREEEEELREERRLPREEQEMLREAYERERAEERARARRTRARGGGGVYPRGE